MREGYARDEWRRTAYITYYSRESRCRSVDKAALCRGVSTKGFFCEVAGGVISFVCFGQGFDAFPAGA